MAYNKLCVLDVKRFHPLLGMLDFLASNNNYDRYWICEGNDWAFVKVFPKNGFVLLDSSFFENFVITIKVGSDKYQLKPLYIKELAYEQVVFARGDTILFYDYDDSRWYVRFDGIPEKPSNTLFTDYEENKYIVGVSYLRGPVSLPSPILQGEYAEITLTNFLAPEYRERECKLIIDPTNIGYYQKSSSTSIEGIYEGKLAYTGKRFRVGWGVWKDSSGQWVREIDKVDGKTQIQGATYDPTEEKYYIGTKDDVKGWWEFDGTIEFEKDITFNFVRPPESNAELQGNKIFTWVGFKVYSSQITKKTLQQKQIYVSESPVWR